ncbi:MAG TPA: DUF3160 domain-containing protein [Candidatus Pacearchaeota archaeon]|nr:DUF3160 domain-containing protein [Candidatus Pacearchaeota archaeon]
MIGNIGKDSFFVKFISYILIFSFVFYAAYTGFNFLLGKNNQKSNQVQDVSQETPKQSEEKEDIIVNSFAEYTESKIDYNPQIPDYSIDPELANVDMQAGKINDILSLDQKKNLSKNGFVVAWTENGKPIGYNEFFQLYEKNRYSNIPNFITTDSVLHSYHLIFNDVLSSVEKEYLISDLKKLNEFMLLQAYKQYDQLKDTAWENAAKRNLGFYTIGAKLLDDKIKIHDAIKECVQKDLENIAKHDGIKDSCVLNIGNNPDDLNNLKEDFTQYIPRGHYEKDESLKKYFQSMMWYGRINFSFLNEDNIKASILSALALSDKENRSIWEKIYQTTAFFSGKSDDVNIIQIEPYVKEIYGDNPDIVLMASDLSKFNQVKEKIQKISPPQINSMPIFTEEINPTDKEKQILGFRFMGQRYTIDSDIFQRLIDREVPGRMLPNGLDIPAAMGSKEAYSILEKIGETKFPNYSSNMLKIKDKISSMDKKNWSENLYWAWMGTLSPLLEERGQGFPKFMQNQAWQRKSLNSYLGSYAELKHDTILYAKQAYAEMGGGGEDQVPKGYVEPNPEVYAKLYSLVAMTKTGLEKRELIDNNWKEILDIMLDLSDKLKEISQKELNNTELSSQDYDFINGYGGTLEHLYILIAKTKGSVSDLSESKSAIITDIATDPNGSVLEIGNGNVIPIYVIAPIQGNLVLTKGGVYSYREFSWPMKDRLTDSKWREMIEKSDSPTMPDWTSIFVSK